MGMGLSRGARVARTGLRRGGGVPQAAGLFDLAQIWSRPAAADVAVTVLTVAPYLAYLTVTEAGPARATWGKRRVGLTLHDPGGTVTFGQVLVRNTVKVVPWQLGHMSAMRFAVIDTPTSFSILLFVGSMVVLAAVVLPVLVGRPAFTIGWLGPVFAPCRRRSQT